MAAHLTDDHVPDLICDFSTYRYLSVTTDGIKPENIFQELRSHHQFLIQIVPHHLIIII